MRTILHSDMNSCYASIELLYDPSLRGLPVAVGGDPESRHGIVLAKSQEAKRYGVKTGMALWQARQVCPSIVFVPPHYDRYLHFSRLAHEIYADYTDLQEAFGIDECWLDTTASCSIRGDGMKIAREINQRVKKELGVTVSIGVSWNKIFAKFGSDYKKPDAVTEITRENYKDIIWTKPVEDLLYVGPSTTRKLKNVGIRTIGQLAETDPAYLDRMLGKMGLVLYTFANGEDLTPVSREQTEAPVKSIGNGMTTPRDLKGNDDVRIVLYMLAESVGKRLRENHLMGYVVEVGVRDNDLLSFTRQEKISTPTNITKEIAEKAVEIFCRSYRWEKPIRSLCVRVCSLVPDDRPYQTDMFAVEEMRMKYHSADLAVDRVRERFGYNSIQRGLIFCDKRLTGENPSIREIHPHSYMERGNRTGAEALYRR